MPSITLTLTDTPQGAVAIHSSFKPAVGNPCSPAQAVALDIISRTHKQWGIQPVATATTVTDSVLSSQVSGEPS